MKRINEIKLALLILLPILILSSLFSFIQTNEVKSQTTQKTCEDIGYTNISDTEKNAEDKCCSDYTYCLNNPLAFQDEYYTCVGAGGCWDITHWVHSTYQGCPIDINGNLDESHSWFQNQTPHNDGTLKFCQCVAECQIKYSTKRDCDAELDTCCKALLPQDSDTQTQDPAELSKDISDLNKELPDLCKDEENNKSEIEKKVKEMVKLIADDIEQRVSGRSDLSIDQIVEIQMTVRNAVENIEVKKCGEGSKTTEEGVWIWRKNILHIDPLHSPDVIRHELGHLIAQKLIPGYTIPGEDSSHNMEGFSSTHHRAFDEAIATLIAVDIMGQSSYITHNDGNNVKITNLPSMQETGIYSVDLESLSVTTSTGANINTYGPNGSPADKLMWYGPIDDQALFDKIVAKIDNTQTQINTEAAKGESADPGRIKQLMNKQGQMLRLLNPPAYSPKAEVAVASLIYELTGDSPSSKRLGKILTACQNYYDSKSAMPKSELEFLQGYLKGKDWDDDNPTESSEFGVAYLIINGAKHRRGYTIEQLEAL